MKYILCIQARCFNGKAPPHPPHTTTTTPPHPHPHSLPLHTQPRQRLVRSLARVLSRPRDSLPVPDTRRSCVRNLAS